METRINLRTLLFLARKDLLKDWRVLLLVLLAVGSGALAIVPLNGMMTGFTASLTATTVDVAVGHAILVPPEGKTAIRQVKSVVAEVTAQLDVRAVSPRLFARAIASNHDSSEAVVIRGVDPVAETGVTTIAEYIVAGSFLEAHDRDGIVVGQALADKLSLSVGQRVHLLFANLSEDRFVVRGIYDTGVRDLDGGGYLPLRRLQGLLDMNDQASEISVRLNSKDQSAIFASRLQGRWKIETWQERMGFIQSFEGNANIIRQMMVVLSVLAAGIATAVLMYTNVQHKMRAIGILKAIGGRNRAILQLYVLEGLLLGIAGAIVGDILGAAITLYLSAHPIHATLGLSEGASRAMAITTSFSWSMLVVPTISAILVATLASLYPAWQAARINIVEAIWHG